MRAEFNENEQLIITSYGMPEKMALRWWFEQLSGSNVELEKHLIINHKQSALRSVDESPHNKHDLYCHFCGKTQYEVSKLIAGAASYICNECITTCNEMIAEPPIV